MDSSKKYNSEYYSWRASPAISSAEVVVPFLIKHYTIKSVVDLGCAEGAWLSVFHKNGVEHIQGYDGPWVKERELLISHSFFNQLSFESFKINCDKPYDLAISLEVAEHLEEKTADNFILQLTKLSNRILFSAAIPNQGGLHHLNEQPPDYWCRKFENNGFVQRDILRPFFWEDNRIAWWYRQNCFIYEKTSTHKHLSSSIELPSFGGFQLVHPDAFNEKIKELDLDNASFFNIAKSLLIKFCNKWRSLVC